MIAEVRQSPLLLTFLETGNIYDLPPMDLNAAFAQFDITDHSLADDTIISVFSLRVSNAPYSFVPTNAFPVKRCAQ